MDGDKLRVPDFLIFLIFRIFRIFLIFLIWLPYLPDFLIFSLKSSDVISVNLATRAPLVMHKPARCRHGDAVR
jgi:hypothetical protein